MKVITTLAIAFSLALSAQARAYDNSAAELTRQIEELEGQGKYEEAIPPAERLVALARQLHADQNAETAVIITTLAILYERTGEYATAEPLLKEALEICQKVLGPEHPDTATGLNNLALLYQRMGKYAKAEPLYIEALKIDQKVLGRDHLPTALGLDNLALFYHEMGDYAKEIDSDHLEEGRQLAQLAYGTSFFMLKPELPGSEGKTKNSETFFGIAPSYKASFKGKV